jgi:hypothetical protein
MNPASLIPAVDPIPVPALWFDVLLVATFTVHVLLMNAVLGGAAISLVELLRGRPLELPERVSKKLPTVLALTINFGVAPLLFLQVNYGQFDYVSSVLMGGWWLAIIGMLLAAYYGLYIYDLRFGGLGRARALMLALAVGCILYVAFMFSNNMTLMLRPEAWMDYFTRGGAVLLNLADPTFAPRWLHFMTGALAVGGLFVALVGTLGKSERAVGLGMAWLARGTMANALIGIWFLISLPQPIMLRFLGGHAVATLVLLLAVAGALGIIYAGVKRLVWPAVGLAVGTVALMAVARHLVRRFFLEPYFTPADLPVSGQWSSLALFGFALAVGLPIIWWMVRAYCRAGACEPETDARAGSK